MSTIVLVWDLDRNETPLTFSLAQKLKPVLEKRGFAVFLEQFPFAKESLGKGHWPVNRVKLEQYRQHLFEKYPNSFVVDLHTTPDSVLFAQKHREKPTTKVKKWISHVSYGFVPFTYIVGELQLNEYASNHFGLEVPAKYVPSNRYRKKMVALKKQWNGRVPAWELERYRYDPGDYEDSYVRLRQSRAANFLSETVIRKIAHALDTKIRTQLREYRWPRQPPHRYRLSLDARKRRQTSQLPLVFRTKRAKNSRRNELKKLKRRYLH